MLFSRPMKYVGDKLEVLTEPDGDEVGLVVGCVVGLIDGVTLGD